MGLELKGLRLLFLLIARTHVPAVEQIYSSAVNIFMCLCFACLHPKLCRYEQNQFLVFIPDSDFMKGIVFRDFQVVLHTVHSLE